MLPPMLVITGTEALGIKLPNEGAVGVIGVHQCRHGLMVMLARWMATLSRRRSGRGRK